MRPGIGPVASYQISTQDAARIVRAYRPGCGADVRGGGTAGDLALRGGTRPSRAGRTSRTSRRGRSL